MTFVPSRIIELVKTFDRNIDTYRSQQYNETQVRREFIDPFFGELGWDVTNKAGYAHAYKDVIHEDAIKVSGATKAPDYSFRIGGTRKFFLEAKKPSVNIKGDPHPAYQLRRYAWSAKLPLSILTDFEEFAVYDCLSRPKQTDRASTARIMYYTYKEYLDNWSQIADTFSKEAILKGSFDKFAASAKGKRGTTTVDTEFLAEIEKWRNMLARTIALRNRSLSVGEINFAVQRTIDRILFLRLCEDRGIEQYAQLQGISSGDRTYPRLCELFERADQKYNSGLFHFEDEPGRATSPDKLTPNIAIDDKDLKWILHNLYYPQCPYEFSVLPAEILGNVYEQFLGRIITLTKAHQAKIEEKPEVKKAGGVYYTPSYIVDYIVKNTVANLLNDPAATQPHLAPTPAVGGLPKPIENTKSKIKNKQPLTPKQIEKIKILDPACGSGSFLLGAYTYLLNYHRDWYAANDPERWAKKRNPPIYQVSSPRHCEERSDAAISNYRLTITEKKRILLNNIFGVDIDSQAVEVTKLSLLLKVLEDENAQSLENQYRLFHERALPDLAQNIKCGNSLIAPDFFDNLDHLAPTPAVGGSPEELYKKINPFDWKQEFPKIFKRKTPGFDAVIGNPPYGIPFSETELSYSTRKFASARKFPDSYCLFMIQSMRLLREAGWESLIVPNTFCDLENCDDFRSMLLHEWTIVQIWQSGWAFKHAVVDTLVFVANKQKAQKSHLVQIHIENRRYTRAVDGFLSNDLVKIDYRNMAEDKLLLEKVVLASTPLGKLATVKAGVKMYEKGKGTPPQTKATMKDRPFSTEGTCPLTWKPLYRGHDITRYSLEEPREFVDYGPWLAAPRSPELFENPKILMRRTDDRLLSCLETQSAICVNSCHVIKLAKAGESKLTYPFFLGLLNSKLIQHIFELQNPQMVSKVFAEIKVVYVTRLPIRTIDFDNPNEKAIHDKMLNLVDRMLAFHKQLPAVKIPDEKTKIQRQITATDKKIDHLVYTLYNLTKEEIKIVEDA